MDQQERKHWTIDVPCAAHIWSNASRSTAYALARSGELEAKRVGRKLIVRVRWLEDELGASPGQLDSAIDAWLQAKADARGGLTAA
ncbi:helix-turn-helix domain-containing protein [Alphaproteobacteria bacterium]|nr:helix-turn-helix domain-containing protein [Alphaproteobacteria bacterium]